MKLRLIVMKNNYRPFLLKKWLQKVILTSMSIFLRTDPITICNKIKIIQVNRIKIRQHCKWKRNGKLDLTKTKDENIPTGHTTKTRRFYWFNLKSISLKDITQILTQQVLLSRQTMTIILTIIKNFINYTYKMKTCLLT